VKANRVLPADEETIAMFEQNLAGNLYKLWNRMSSVVLPPPVKQVRYRKRRANQKARRSYRFRSNAQTVVKLTIEPILNRYSMRIPMISAGQSAKQAIAVTRRRCWQYDWIIELT